MLAASLEMADPTAPNIRIALSQPLMREVAEMARDAQTTEDALVRRAIEALVRAQRGPGIPRFARRLGPIAIAEDHPPAA